MLYKLINQLIIIYLVSADIIFNQLIYYYLFNLFNINYLPIVYQNVIKIQKAKKIMLV